MTDPNVIEAIRKLARAVELLARPIDFRHRAGREATEVIGTLDALLAAAEKPAAPPIVPVRFDDNGNARGDGWEASRNSNSSGDVVLFSVLIRPGEDAGEVAARMLATIGRTP